MSVSRRAFIGGAAAGSAVLCLKGSIDQSLEATELDAEVGDERLLEKQILFGLDRPRRIDVEGFRIPAMTVTTRGTVLALCEAAEVSPQAPDNVSTLPNSEADPKYVRMSILLRRSTDHGKTFKPVQRLFDGLDKPSKTLGFNQATVVVDRDTHRVWLIFCECNRKMLVAHSDDDGVSWSPPTDITSIVPVADWTDCGAGPGHGIQLSNGRLLVTGWLAHADRAESSWVIFSDDHGKSWKASLVDRGKSEECQVVETANGAVYLTGRNTSGHRACARSKDGGATWSRIEYDTNLPDPYPTEASIIRFTDAMQHDKNRILFSNPPGGRQRLTVRLSYDECRTWPIAKVLEPKDAAYSELTVAADKTILCLYEAEQAPEPRTLVLARFNLAWLTDGKDRISRNDQ